MQNTSQPLSTQKQQASASAKNPSQPLNMLPVGVKVKWRDDVGEIAFSCEECVTIRCHNPNSQERQREVRVVCPKQYWDEIELLSGNHRHHLT